MREDAPQRTHPLRELFNGLRYIARTGLQWRYMPTDLPPWPAVSQQTRRWLDADVFTAIIADLRELIRLGGRLCSHGATSRAVVAVPTRPRLGHSLGSQDGRSTLRAGGCDHHDFWTCHHG